LVAVVALHSFRLILVVTRYLQLLHQQAEVAVELVTEPMVQQVALVVAVDKSLAVELETLQQLRLRKETVVEVTVVAEVVHLLQVQAQAELEQRLLLLGHQ
jgi:hypothetical protein